MMLADAERQAVAQGLDALGVLPAARTPTKLVIEVCYGASGPDRIRVERHGEDDQGEITRRRVIRFRTIEKALRAR